MLRMPPPPTGKELSDLIPPPLGEGDREAVEGAQPRPQDFL